jgi:hypothetical protein
LGVARPDGDGDGVGPLVAAPDVGDGFVGAAFGVEVRGDDGASEGALGFVEGSRQRSRMAPKSSPTGQCL